MLCLDRGKWSGKKQELMSNWVVIFWDECTYNYLSTLTFPRYSFSLYQYSQLYDSKHCTDSYNVNVTNNHSPKARHPQGSSLLKKIPSKENRPINPGRINCIPREKKGRILIPYVILYFNQADYLQTPRPSSKRAQTELIRNKVSSIASPALFLPLTSISRGTERSIVRLLRASTRDDRRARRGSDEKRDSPGWSTRRQKGHRQTDCYVHLKRNT